MTDFTNRSKNSSSFSNRAKSVGGEVFGDLGMDELAGLTSLDPAPRVNPATAIQDVDFETPLNVPEFINRTKH